VLGDQDYYGMQFINNAADKLITALFRQSSSSSLSGISLGKLILIASSDLIVESYFKSENANIGYKESNSVTETNSTHASIMEILK
jgi:hypothetical protein